MLNITKLGTNNLWMQGTYTGESRNFLTGDTLLHIPYVFVVRVENKTHIVTFLVDYKEVYASYSVKIFKNETLKNFKRGRTPGAAMLHPPLT